MSDRPDWWEQGFDSLREAENAWQSQAESDAEQMPSLTTEVTVTCSFCKQIITVPFRHGAVMPAHDSDQGVHVWVPRLDGGDHECQSDRHKSERAFYERSLLRRCEHGVDRRLVYCPPCGPDPSDPPQMAP